MASKRNTVPTVTVSDSEYQLLLQHRLETKHAFEADPTKDELLKEYREARALVRKARKVRKSEAAELQQIRDIEATKQAKRSEAAKKAAATRQAKRQQSGPDTEVTEPETVSEPEVEVTENAA